VEQVAEGGVNRPGLGLMTPCAVCVSHVNNCFICISSASCTCHDPQGVSQLATRTLCAREGHVINVINYKCEG